MEEKKSCTNQNKGLKVCKTAYVWLSALAAWIITCVHGWVACLTYDEAYSYCYYIHPLVLNKWDSVKAIFTDCLANNHILNTVLCNLSVKITGKTWDDFVIRIPVLIFFLGYLAMVLILYHKKKIGCVAASLLIWNFYLCEFFSLARGYGLAAALVMMAVVMYELWCDSGYVKYRYLSLFLLFMTLGVAANTIVLIIFAAFIPCIFIRLVQRKKLFSYIGKQCFVWIPLLAANVLMFRYHLMVTESEKPLYVGARGLWTSVWEGYVRMFAQNDLLVGIVAVLVLMLAIAGIVLMFIHKRAKQSRYVLPVCSYLFLLLVMQYGIRSGLPTGRTLLPFYPVVILFLVECMRELAQTWKELVAHGVQKQAGILQKAEKALYFTKPVVGVLGCVLLITIFFVRTDPESYSDWSDEKDYKKIAYDSIDNPEADYETIGNMDYPMQYYWAQIYINEKFDIYSGQRVQ